MKLEDGSRVAIVGGGPSGSMVGFFLLEVAGHIGLDLEIDLYEPRDFQRLGPAGCNMCAGVISESLVQTLAAEGINLPPLVVQRGINSYVLRTSGLKPVTIQTPSDDLRIATVYRGSGPNRPTANPNWTSFDGYLLDLARRRGVNLIPQRVTRLGWDGERPQVKVRNGTPKTYDLLIGAAGVNAPIKKQFKKLGFEYAPPPANKAFVCEIYLGEELTQLHLGNAMHVFLLDIPGLKFAALIPKVEYVTVCLLGDGIDKELVLRFMDTPEVRDCFPPGWEWCCGTGQCEIGEEVCHCSPKLSVGMAKNPFTDRVVMVGDSAISRLYKDGIGAAYITAKAAAVTAVFMGISKEAFRESYWPVCSQMNFDNRLGGIIFFVTTFYQRWLFMRRGMATMVAREQKLTAAKRIMSRVLWDTFTGSATYREILFKAINPVFIVKLAFSTLSSLVRHWLWGTR